MLTVQWSAGALKDLATILGYLTERNGPAAISLQARIEQITSQLPDHPYLYRRGRIAGTREIVVQQNYIIVYRIGPTAIRIVTVTHARQRFPRIT